MALPASITYPERQIVATIVTEALAHGLRVSVYDGEEWTLKGSTDFEAITAAIGTTDTTTLKFRDPRFHDQHGHAEPVGSVFLVHGNGSEVIADYTDSARLKAILARAEDIAETFSAAGC